ncbi:4-phosphopantoate--beta-alanine ligase [Methanobacterium sp.]|uniref:4-phosphopantoate--beta-alanine ligase n=1 Tax=Methanobacterium sp. TaxID=2164 RepID=UPI003C7698F1
MIHNDHPRYESLKLREKIVDAYKKGILAESGMIAHGRGEAFDYLLGEKKTVNSEKAVRAAAAALILAKNPVISVNGNTVALVPNEIVILADDLDAKIEINLFHRTEKRVSIIEKVMNNAGAKNILGTDHEEKAKIKGLEGPRANSSREGVYIADVVLVPLEDGDRAEALVKLDKLLITIDLNPLSRTAKTATITIVDNIVRAIPNLIQAVHELRNVDDPTLHQIVNDFNNQENLDESLKKISDKHTGRVKP